MQGYVLVYRPTTGDGTIVTETGRAIRFGGTPADVELHGGDIVTFELGLGGSDGRVEQVRDIHVLQKGSQHLAASQQGLLRELHNTIRMDAPVH